MISTRDLAMVSRGYASIVVRPLSTGGTRDMGSINTLAAGDDRDPGKHARMKRLMRVGSWAVFHSFIAGPNVTQHGNDLSLMCRRCGNGRYHKWHT